MVMLKKVLILWMCLMLLLCSAACKNEAPKTPDPDPTEQTQQSSETDTQPDSVPKTDSQWKKLTFTEFMEKVEGVWIHTDTIEPIWEGYYYEFCIISNETCVGGVYPGSYGRPGKIDGYEQQGENRFVLQLLYEAGYDMDEPVPEKRETLVVTLLADGKATLTYSTGAECAVIFGGEDLEDAQKAATVYVQQQA